MAPLIPPVPPIVRRLPPPSRSTFLFGARGTGKTTYARQCLPDALVLDLRAGPRVRVLGAEPERLHGMLDASPPSQWVVIDEIPRVPALLDVLHERLDREPARRFLLTGSSARALHRAGVNLLGGRAGRSVMPSFIAAELGEAFSVGTAQRIGLLPIVWTAADPERALADYATAAVFDEVRAEARIRQIEAFARALEQLALSHGSVFSPTALALRPSEIARTLPEASGAAREGLVYQHLAAWCSVTRDACLWTWRTTAGLEVDFVVETADEPVAVEMKRGRTMRPADRRGLLAFHDEFPEARLIAVTDAEVAERDGVIPVLPVAAFLRGIVPGEELWPGMVGGG
ncbi:MAG: ATP-binding protein [Gemmatimonadetes bacterium]|nr:ATP-binding protein [Gemmatimonadota bacterium]